MKYIELYKHWLISESMVSDNHVDAEKFYFKYVEPYVRKGFNMNRFGFDSIYEHEEYTDEDFEKIIDILESKCGKFLEMLKKYKQYPIFRGVPFVDESSERGIYYKTSYSNRSPRDTDPDISNLFDDKFHDKFGVKIRSNGIFTSKTPAISFDYGSVYLFFPIGEYKYFWNPNIDDLYNNFQYAEWYNNYINNWENWYDRFSRGREGVWSYKGVEYSASLADSISDAKNSNIEIRNVSNDKVSRMMEWIPDMDEDELLKKSVDEANIQIKKIIDGYQEGNIDKIEKQEITFICKDYYLVDPAFYRKFTKYLNLKSS